MNAGFAISAVTRTCVTRSWFVRHKQHIVHTNGIHRTIKTCTITQYYLTSRDFYSRINRFSLNRDNDEKCREKSTKTTTIRRAKLDRGDHPVTHVTAALPSRTSDRPDAGRWPETQPVTLVGSRRSRSFSGGRGRSSSGGRGCFGGGREEKTDVERIIHEEAAAQSARHVYGLDESSEDALSKKKKRKRSYFERHRFHTNPYINGSYVLSTHNYQTTESIEF